MTQPLFGLLMLLFVVQPPAASGQGKTIVPDMAKIGDGAVWSIDHADVETLETAGRRAVRLTAHGDSANGIVGLALVRGMLFATGTVEVDLKGKNVRQRSFLGIAFNVADQNTFEAVYFRPFNFRADGEFKGRAVQYIAWPANTWEKLRKERPGTFESPISPVPDPDGWFHARIEVGAKQVRVYVNEASEPCLTVDRLSGVGKDPRLGLFVDSADGEYANLKITPTK
jgi:hypothetical protein